MFLNDYLKWERIFTVQAWVKYNGGGSYRSKRLEMKTWNFGLHGT